MTELCQSGMMDASCVIALIDTLEKQAIDVYPVVQRCLVSGVHKHIQEKKDSTTEPSPAT